MTQLDRSVGRAAFGDDPANYHASRPPYPEAVWQALRRRAGLRPGIDILEIGAGTGLATKHLLAHRPTRLVAIEPDPRMSVLLDPSVDVVTASFEEAAIGEQFDLVASATAFHWLDAVPALHRIGGLLRPSGAIALWWNVHGDPERPDAFHVATQPLFAGNVASPAEGRGGIPYALDTAARLADLSAAGFSSDPPEFIGSTVVLDPPCLRRLYATYSNVTALPPLQRERLLDGLVSVAERQFGGRVERNMVTAIYTARPGAAPG